MEKEILLNQLGQHFRNIAAQTETTTNIGHFHSMGLRLYVSSIIRGIVQKKILLSRR